MNKQTNVEYRRDRVVELYSEGRNQLEIARILNTSQPTVNRDLQLRRQESRSNAKTYLDEYLPFEHKVCQVGINRILKKAWDIANSEHSTEKAVFQALNLAKDCYSLKNDLLSDDIIIENAVDFVQSHKQLKELEVQNEINDFYVQEGGQRHERGRVF